MRHNLAKEKLAAGRPISVVAPGYTSAGLVELLGRMGFDAFFIVPGDLAQSMGHPGRPDHPDVQAAIQDTVRRVRAAGRAPGVLTTNGASARRYLALGALFIYVALASLLQPGTRDFLAEFK